MTHKKVRNQIIKATAINKKLALAFQFSSKRNSGNVRLYSLLKRSSTTTTIEIKGINIAHSDRVFLFLLRAIRRAITPFLSRKFDWLHIMSPEEGMGLTINQILHLDDPEFSLKEAKALKKWKAELDQRGKKGMIICTFDGCKSYLNGVDESLNVHLIPQGFTPTYEVLSKFERFSCVYSSPYISGVGDKNADHPTWSAVHFLEELLPELLQSDEELEIHLIGRLSKKARAKLSNEPRIVLHGLVTPEENARILAQCHLGLYPRIHDHGRRVLKITEYMGAGLPIVAYDLEDTRLVSEKNIGFLVSTQAEFVAQVLRLKRDSELYSQFLLRVRHAQIGSDWDTLAKQLDNLIKEVELYKV